MERGSNHLPLFEKTDTGILIKTGDSSEFWVNDSSSYLSIKEKALKLKAIFQAYGLTLQKAKTLMQLIQDACDLSDAWLCDQMDRISFQQLLNTLMVDRIGNAIIPIIETCDNPKKILKDLINGNIDLLARNNSKAKNTLWELEVLNILKQHGIKARIGEPDILFSFSGPSLGIACKKLYSEANVGKVVSQAISQIERDVEFGIVALNIDDLLPDNHLLKAPTINDMSQMLQNIIFDFLRNHERHFRKYLQPGRALAVLASCGVIADVSESKFRFLNARQSIGWVIPGLSYEKETQMNYFLDSFRANYPQ
jgi:hypothetical protein